MAMRRPVRRHRPPGRPVRIGAAVGRTGPVENRLFFHITIQVFIAAPATTVGAPQPPQRGGFEFAPGRGSLTAHRPSVRLHQVAGGDGRSAGASPISTGRSILLSDRPNSVHCRARDATIAVVRVPTVPCLIDPAVVEHHERMLVHPYRSSRAHGRCRIRGTWASGVASWPAPCRGGTSNTRPITSSSALQNVCGFQLAAPGSATQTVADHPVIQPIGDAGLSWMGDHR